MTITYIFHSGFAIEFENFSIIIDYYSEPKSQKQINFVHSHLLKKKLPLYVLSTHSHYDHFDSSILSWKQTKKDIKYIFSSDILENQFASENDALYMKKSDTYTDENLHIKAFGSTDLGISFYIEAENKKIFHAGDLNNWHWDEESTLHEIKVSEAYYERELNFIAEDVKHLDLVIFPIDPRLGKNFMKGAEQFVKKIKTDTFAPMHFSSSPEKIKEFKSFAKEHHVRYLCWKHPEESIII